VHKVALEEGGAISATSLPTAVTTHATLNDTYNGTYTELIASTSAESYRVHVVCTNIGTRNARWKLATGAVSSEVDFAEFVPQWGRNESNIRYFSFPVTIPSGARVSANLMTSSGAPTTVKMQIYLSDNSDVYGTSTESELWNDGQTDAEGQDLDPGTTANTKGSWVQLIASSDHDVNQIVMCVGNSLNSGVSPSGTHLIDIGVGAAASEVVIVENVFHSQDSAESGAHIIAFDVDTISAGSRIAARCQSTYTTESDRLIDCALTAFNVIPPAGGGIILLPNLHSFAVQRAANY